MRTARIGLLVGVVAILLVGGGSVAFSELATDEDTQAYFVVTPAPTGRATCVFTVSGEKLAGVPAVLEITLLAGGGEALIPEMGVSGGSQPG